ncbi:MAG: hypothetical protein ACT4TC_08635 [Myxococcaceae bacterium]
MRVGALVVAVLGLSSAAVADVNDIRLYQLGNPSTPGANANFRAFARELGVAMSSVNLMPPETLGHAGFAVSAELSSVFMSARDPSNGGCTTAQEGCFLMPTQSQLGGTPFNGTWLMPSIHLRKGLPLSLELGTRIAWLDRSRMASITGEVKWALNEGFAYLPDIGVRAHATRLLNARDFEVTSGGIDLGVGKQFAIGGMLTVTPYVGWNLIWVGAASSSVDFNPGRSAADSIANPTAQFTDTNVYDPVNFGSNAHNRFYGGVRLIAGAFQVGIEASGASMGKFRDESTGTDRSLPVVGAFNFNLGLDF